MRFKLLSGAVSVLLVAILVGCGGGSTSSPSTNQLVSIAISPSGISVPFGTPQQFTATGHYSNGSSKVLTSGVSWSSSATNVATVDSNGLAVPVRHGTTTIGASFSSVNGSTGLTVTTAATSLSLSPTTAGIFVGTAQQFTATADNDDGTTQNVTSSVVWDSSDPSNATINNLGRATGLHGGHTTITATLGGLNQSADLTMTALLQSISLSPIGPAIDNSGSASGSVQFTAVGHFNDATTQNLTSTANWNSSDPGKASVAAGLANGKIPGYMTITAAGTSPDGSTVVGSTALDVIFRPVTPPNLDGNYAFTLTSADRRGPQFFAGSFTADGSGNIIGGVEDANAASGVFNAALTGTYVVYPDGRGNIMFAPNAIHPSGITLRFILAASNGTPWATGKLAQFDGQGTAKGTLDLQSAVSFGAGTYVFRTGGIDSGTQTFDNGAPQPMGQVGIFAADGAGHITAGTVDTNDFANVFSLVSLVPSGYAVNGSGRGTLQLATAASASNFAVYVVNSNKLNLIQIDPAPANAIAGVAELQTGQPFSVSDLDSGYAFLIDRPVVVGDGGNADRREFAQVGEYTFDGAGGISGVRDDANNEGANPLNDIVGGYALASNGGRGTLRATSILGNTDRSYIFYMVSKSRMFVLQTFTGSNQNAASLNAPTGVAEQQTQMPYGKGTLNGSFALDASDLTATYTEALMRLSFDGNGNIAGIADVSFAGSASSAVVGASYSGLPDSSTGRGRIALTDQVGAKDFIFYLDSSQKAWILGVTPPEVGSILKQ